ncbi:MAG: aldehyde-activating protein [Alphaproteobacteria bacterium]|nr:aldehyde-activating protein [Alphaproteobacteria bacterium]
MVARPPVPPPPHKGGCLCGAARFSLSARPLAVNACHCNACKKLTGATNLLMLLGERAAFSFTGDVERYRRRADSGREIDVVRCANCGVRMWHEPLSAPDLVFIAAGTLDDTSWAVPASHIWAANASAGVVFQDDALVVPGQPARREDLMEAFARLYAN